MIKSKPYIKILEELGYMVISEDNEILFDKNKNPNAIKSRIIYSSNVYYRICLSLFTSDLCKVNKYLSKNDITVLDLNNISIFQKDTRILTFFDIKFTEEDNQLYDISRITPEVFRKLLIIIKDYKSKDSYFNKLLKKYIDFQENILEPIINPIVESKGFLHNSSLDRLDDFFTTNNNNIEIIYYTEDLSKSFVIGLDYVTEKTYFYFKSNNIIFDVENIIITKGRFKELMEKFL